jgi:hypothetical protein
VIAIGLAMSGLSATATATGSPYQAAVVAANPVGLWRLNDAAGSGSAVDLTGGHTGSAGAGVTFGLAGPLNDLQTAAAFTGASNATVFVPDNAAFHFSNVVSLECWAYGDPAMDGVSRGVWTFANANQDGFLTRFATRFTARLTIGGSQATLNADGLTIPATWNYLALTYDGSLLSFYVNGALVTSTPASGAIDLGTSGFNIGGVGAGSNFNGRLGNATLYNVALSAGDIAAHYALRTAPTLTPAISRGASGVSGTGSAGTVQPQLVGVSASGVLGALGGVAALPIASVAGTGSPGTVALGLAPALSGVPANTAVGTEAPSISIMLLGLPAAGAVGVVSSSTPGSGDLTGVSTVAAVGTLQPSVSVSSSGQEASGAIGLLSRVISFIDRPQSLAGPFPFLTGGFFKFRSPVRQPVLPQSQSVTVQLIGLNADSSQGALTPSAVRAMSGQAAPGALGTATAGITVGLSGVQAAGATGTLQISQDLSGVSATSSTGIEASAISVMLVGATASGSIGTVAAQVGANATVGLSGVGASVAAGVLTPITAPALTGTAASTATGTLPGPSLTIQPTGASSSPAVGTLGPQTVRVVTSVLATSSVGAVSNIVGPTLVGLGLVGSAGNSSIAIDRPMTGVPAATGNIGFMRSGSAFPPVIHETDVTVAHGYDVRI